MLIVALAVSVTAGEQTRAMLFDGWQRLSPRTVAARNVRVVMIDGESLAAIGPWPWPRYYLGRLTEDLTKQGAKVIGFDVLFPEADRLNPQTFAPLYPELSESASSEISALPSMDQIFGQVVGQSPVVLARAGASKGIRDGNALTVDAKISGSLPPRIDQWPAAITAIPELEDSALGHGLVNGQPDSDGVIRAIPMVIRVAGRPMPGFALELARLELDAHDILFTPSDARIAGRKIPMDARGRMHLRFGKFPDGLIVSASDVFGHTLPPDYFRGKVVLVGLGAEGTSDIVATPLASENFGVVVQAEAVDAILSGGWLSRPAWASPVEWGLAALIAVLAIAAAFGGRPARIAVATALIALPVGSWVVFHALALLLDATRPVMIGGGALAGVVIGLFAEARRDREQLREALVQEKVAAAQTEGELQAARAIQMSMVPPRAVLADIDPRLDVDALLEPARSVGGDLYDIARLDDDRIGFLIGDVTGKGVPAALFMAMSKALTSFVLSRDNADLGRAVVSVNEELLRGTEAMSVTMVIGILDLGTGVASLVCAGHEDPITRTAAGQVQSHRLEGGPPLGLTQYDYPLEQLELSIGDALILVTDGITEAQDGDGALYGRQRVLSEIEHNSGSAAQICEDLRNDVRSFEAGHDPTDDLTVMTLRYLGADSSAP